jgi:hypothetical protein
MSEAHVLSAQQISAVLDATAPTNQSATKDYPITVTIFEQFGRAFIGWSLDPNYAIGQNDTVYLFEGTNYSKSFSVKVPAGNFDTGHGWGSGLNAQYWAFSYATSSYKILVRTPNT